MKPVNYLHTIVNLADGDWVEVSLHGLAANVFVMDAANFQHYRNGAKFEYTGGYFVQSPCKVVAPKPGRWYVVIDSGGKPGKASGSIRVVSAAKK